MSQNIKEALLKRFQEQRVIFWYDEKQELIEQYEELNIPEVEKLHVEGNEFEVKHTVVKSHPERKFLLYFTGEKPANEKNWLLDMELAHHVFHTDKEAMFLQEIGLSYHLKELVTEHLEFFKAKERRVKLKDLLGEGDEHEDIRGKMLAVTFGTDFVNINSYIQAHATFFIEGTDKYEKDLERYKLTRYYWGKIKNQFNYDSENPSIKDFLLEIFNANFALGVNSYIKKESRLLLLQWKDTIKFRDSFSKVSEKLASEMDVEIKLQQASIEEIIQDDLFKLVDQKVIHELVSLLLAENFSLDTIRRYLKARENKFWYHEYQYFYNCIDFGADFLKESKSKNKTTYKTIDEGVKSYADSLYKVDQLYRKFIYNYRKTNQNRILDALEKKIEKVYANEWLLTYNNNWQTVINATSKWPSNRLNSQRKFFDKHVGSFIKKNQRLFVIISDALRYECGAELNDRIMSENRYESEIDSMIASVPSYTQLGMASLLPNKMIQFQKGGDGILVDGLPASGIQGRAKILNENSGIRATAILADEFMNMNANKEGRRFVKQYDLIYIYHNRIDKIGDDKVTEEKVFDAVDEELNYVMDMLKKISNMNGNNMIITSDHGFIYQHNELDESDFMNFNVKSGVWKKNRRFVLGNNIEERAGTTKYSGEALGIKSKVDVIIPKSVNRIRVQGAGSRFVHGGTSLQEIVIPVIKVSKKRQDTTSQVDVDIIKTTDKITTNILAVSFIQSELVTEKVLSRTIRASIVADDNEVLSDVFRYNFDIEEGSERQREVKHRFQLFGKASGQYKNQRAKLILEEPIEGTTKWKQYKEYFYTLNISFTNDFDDF